LGIRQLLSSEVRHEKSRIIAEKLESLPVFKLAQDVLFYYGVRGEVKTLPLIQKYLELKSLYLPVIVNETTFHATRLRSPLKLIPNTMGIPEPEKGDMLNETPLDLIIVPGIAFDAKGHRIGMGKGYYDRFLAQYPHALKIGLAFTEQMVENLPQDPYDVSVDMIITDSCIYECG